MSCCKKNNKIILLILLLLLIIIVFFNYTIEPKYEHLEPSGNFCNRIASFERCKNTRIKEMCKNECSKYETTSINTNCVDSNNNCESMAKSGECLNNSSNMITNCPRSCNACNMNKDIVNIISTKEDEIKKLLNNNCIDLNNNCSQLSQNNGCKNNPGYMNVRCTKTCNVCSQPQQQPVLIQTISSEIKPKPTCLRDIGYGDSPRGWYDYSKQGVRNDYCRFVGDAPKVWFSCKLAGTGNNPNDEYTPYSETNIIDPNTPHDPYTGYASC